MAEQEELATLNKDEQKDVYISELDAVVELEIMNDLLQAKPRATDMPIPKELDDYIQRGLTKGIKAQKAGQVRKWSTLVACILLVALITTARVYPAVAAVLQQIPGLGYIVELINYDKGLQSAVENDFIQPLGVSDEHENVVFTVDGIIMDESSLVIFYTVENKRGQGIVDFSEVKLSDEMGEPLKNVSIDHSSPGNLDPDGDGKVQSRINVTFNDRTIIPNRLSLDVRLAKSIIDEPPHRANQLSSTWKVTIPVDKEKFAGMKTVYVVNQSVFIEGQKITFEKVTVFPTSIELNVSYDPENSKRIFAFDDLILVNEKGEAWGRMMNGVTGSKIDENHDILFFQSNYFTPPKKLFLRGKSIRALDKKDTRVILDLEKERILEGPLNLVLDQVIKIPSENETELNFSMKTNPELDEKHGYDVFSSKFTDVNGQSFNIKASGYSISMHSDKLGYAQTITVSIPDNVVYQSPITFQIQDYLSRITGEFDIRIK